MSRRVEELDSLRGLAALTVVFSHLLLMLTVFDAATPNNFVERILISTPLNVLWAGHQAVILFFVLSGFVLSLPFYGDKRVSHSVFITKRICRIYIPYLCAIVTALMARSVIDHGTITQLSGYFNRQWETPLTWGNIIDHLVMIGPQFNTDTLDSPVWSLIHEMRISLVFPLLMLLINRFGWKLNIGIGLFSAAIGMGFQIHYHGVYQPVYKSLPYILMFIVGALIAKHRCMLVCKMRPMSGRVKSLMLVVGLLFYVTTDWMFHGHMLVLKASDDFQTLIGSATVILLSLSWNPLSKFLLYSPIKFLGKISYSLYLFHVIALYFMTYLFIGILPIWIIWFLILSVSILLATGAYYLIEVPSIKLGRMLTSGKKGTVTGMSIESLR